MTDDATFPARHAGVDHRPDLGAALHGCINSVLSTVADLLGAVENDQVVDRRPPGACAPVRSTGSLASPVWLVGGPTVGAPVVINVFLSSGLRLDGWCRRAA